MGNNRDKTVICKRWWRLGYCSLLLLLMVDNVSAREFRIDPDTDLKSTLKRADRGDTLVLANGTWNDVDLRFGELTGTARRPIHIRAETPGKVVLTGKVRFRVSGEHVVVSGLAFRNPTGMTNVFEFRTHSEKHAHHCRITECSFEQTESGSDEKSLWLNIYGTNNRVDHCYFSGKRNLGTTLVVWVDEETPGSHRIDHNHFGPRPELGENGGETIRVGTSDVSESVSRTTVEENYFQHCNGEAEIISNKSCENIYRYNQFDQCEGALTLRHGHRCLVDGNVFLGHEKKRTGGVRIIGSNHRVTNNYFEGLRGDSERAAISIMNGIPNGPLNGYAPVRKALIAHNTVIDCKVSMEFGVGSSKKNSIVPSDCHVSHNAFLPGKWELFRVREKPDGFTWTGNKHQSGKTRGAELVDIERADIQLTRGTDGLLRPTDTKSLETDEQTNIKTDIDGEARNAKIAGCDDPSTKITIRELTKTTGPNWRQQ